MGWYAAVDGSVRSKGTMYFMLHPHALNMSDRWVGLGYDDRIMTGWAAAGQTREETEATLNRLLTSEGLPASMNELCEVVITAPDPDWLKDFSRKLVEQRLAASAHNFAPIRSVYRWRGDIYERTEGRVSLHTQRDRVATIVALAKQEHPYEVPGISTRTITDGNPDYLA
jgi:periplasmic divalent cation tolerance protein